MTLKVGTSTVVGASAVGTVGGLIDGVVERHALGPAMGTGNNESSQGQPLTRVSGTREAKDLGDTYTTLDERVACTKPPACASRSGQQVAAMPVAERAIRANLVADHG